jgi:hypothetical protein
LELNTDNVENATRYLNSNGVKTCDESEQLPENMHWITDPAGTALMKKETQTKATNIHK